MTGRPHTDPPNEGVELGHEDGRFWQIRYLADGGGAWSVSAYDAGRSLANPWPNIVELSLNSCIGSDVRPWA